MYGMGIPILSICWQTGMSAAPRGTAGIILSPRFGALGLNKTKHQHWLEAQRHEAHLKLLDKAKRDWHCAIIPGGQWLLVGDDACGSMTAYDLNVPTLTGRLLIPPDTKGG
jgi:hypothetical protein